MVLIAVIVGAVFVPLAAWRIVGIRRHRDPLLLPALILALGFTLGGLVELLSGDWRIDSKLAFGVLAFAFVAFRWKRASAILPPAV